MADAAVRASVRQMVEFSLRGGDLLPISMAAMQEGGRAHRARQSSVEATSERPVRWQGSCGGQTADIQGRIDLLWEKASPLCVEELKLISPIAPLPEAAVPAHRMQAVCYGFMLCEEMGLPEIRIQVSYVTEQGEVRAAFAETLSRTEAEAEFFSMLQPLAEWAVLQTEYRKKRDAALAEMPFPYPAYRPGQREMAVQVYTAIDRKKRLFATLPTGTGKSAATLFPALKALGQGKTRQIFYLTARGTAQLSALDAIERMRQQGLILRSTVLTAREKCCPISPMRCHPDFCPRARGYYDRELPALLDACRRKGWNSSDLKELCDRYALCPFEFSLTLCEISDAVICDCNYVFDPLVSLKGIIGQGLPATLLMDEAHNLPGRTREMLSARLDSRDLAALRRETGRLHGRKHPVYTALSAFLKALRGLDAETVSLLSAPVETLIATLAAHLAEVGAEGYQECFRELLQFRMALERLIAQPEDYRVLTAPTEREMRITLLCLNVSSHLQAVTRRMTGCVYFSATLAPLDEMKTLLGGKEEDAVFSLPSPFPADRLRVLVRAVDTRYQQRKQSAEEIARCVLALFDGRAGKYVVYFPSYAYLTMVTEQLSALRPNLPLNVQDRGMDDTAQTLFLNRMRKAKGALLSLCVMGGVFAEGIDLPGDQLIGAAVVGVGLPQVNEIQEALRAHYQQTLQEGFAFAYRYPGMQKVLQAAGRVIRSEKDAGVVLLLDARYREAAYARLLPPHYHPVLVADADEIRILSQEFWRTHGIDNGSNE